MRKIAALCWLLAGLPLAAPAPAAQPQSAQAAEPQSVQAAKPQLVIEDNDFLGPGGSDLQSTIPLLADPGVRVLGFTVVAGDDWENAESAHLRRFLEIAHRREIPVVDGATLPLVNSVGRMRLWERTYGPIPWKGAWGGLGSIDRVPATQPAVPKLDEGAPTLAAVPERAADFLIRMVHAHPHQVTIVAAGPLTNLALAIRLDPDFAATARQLVFMGGLIDTNMMAVTGNADFASDFNLIFDPEAAHIVLTAPWARIVSVGNVSNDIMMTRPLMARIAADGSAFTRYLSRYYAPLPMWDELDAAVAVDPSLITRSVSALMDVDTSPGINYGHAHLWTAALAPEGMGLRPVLVVLAVDRHRFLQRFVGQALHMGAHDRAVPPRAPVQGGPPGSIRRVRPRRMLHLIKLAVGAADPAELVERQAARARQQGAHGGRPFLWTRNLPRRADEILAGGSIYWVTSGTLLCRQLVHDIRSDRRDDGTPCTAIVLKGAPVPVTPRLVRPFQGWRYLSARDAPEDLGSLGDGRGDALPDRMRRDLAALCLL